MMVLPGEQTENMTFSLKINGVWKELSKAAPIGGFVRGNKYVVTLNTEDPEWSTNEFTDSRDGNTYGYKTIGTQVWMTENLAYLPSVVGPATSSNEDPYCYVYDYDGEDVTAAKATAKYQTYGVLYNWPAAMNGAASSDANPSGVQGVCPDGWHLPSREEFYTLNNSVSSGGDLKEIGTAHWRTPNEGATNSSGFTALPGGYRYFYTDEFESIAHATYFWATEESHNYAYNMSLNYQLDFNLVSTGIKGNGCSVRCVKD